MPSPLWLLVFMLSRSASLVAGTASTVPEPGARIRPTIRRPERQRGTGVLVSVANDTVTMHAGDKQGGLLALSMRDFTRFEVRRGIRAVAEPAFRERRLLLRRWTAAPTARPGGRGKPS